MRKFLTRALLVSVLAISGLAVNSAASPASAAACSGTKIDSNNYYSDNTGLLVARVGVYRSGGTLCFIAVKDGVLYGESTRMVLSVTPSWKTDDGYFLYYAGPITVTDTGCVSYHLKMWNRANDSIVDPASGSGCY